MDENEKNTAEKRTPLGDEPQETSSGRGGIGGGQGPAPGALKRMAEREDAGGFPPGVDRTRGSQAGQGILEGEEQNAMKPLPASKPQEGMPAHLEGGPHEPATQQRRQQRSEQQGQQGAQLPEGAQSHTTRTDLQGSRDQPATRGATGGTEQRQAMPGSHGGPGTQTTPQPRSRPDMGQPHQRVRGSPKETGGVGTTVGGNTARDKGENEKERKEKNAGVTGGTSTTGDVPGGGGH